MAEVHFLRCADKVGPSVLPEVVEKTELPGCDMYRGSAERLVTAGVVEMHQLPGQPGRGKTTAAYTPEGKPAGRSGGRRLEPGYKRIVRVGKDRFIVNISVSEDKGARRRELYVHKAARDAAGVRAPQEASKRLGEALAKIPKNADEFRQSLNSRINACSPLEFLRRMVTGAYPFDAGFTLDAKTLRAFDALCARMLMIIGSGGVELNAQRQEAIIAEIKQGVFADDASKENLPRRRLRLVLSQPKEGCV